METKKPLIVVALTGGLIIGLLLIVYAIILYMLGLTTSKSLGYLNYLIIAVCIFLFSKNYRDKELNGFITFGQSLGYGLLMGLFSSILLAIFTFIMYKIIDPGLVEKLIDIARDQALKKGATEEQFEMGMKYVKFFVSPTFIAIMTVIGNTVVSLIISLIVSAIVKKERNPFDTAMKDVKAE
jgi:hypothetical protein